MAPPPPRELLRVIEAALLGPGPPSPAQRVELFHAVRDAAPLFRSLLSYPGPKASDRTQVESKEVRLPDMPPITLDDTDVKTALKLSDELNLNEIECVRLLVDANREWVLYGREPLEIYRLAAGLWYMERRDLITSLYILLRSVGLDQGLDADVISEIQEQMELLFSYGLRLRIVTLVKELNREEPAGIGRPGSERYVLDFRGALVERRAIVSRERLSLSHCLALSGIIKIMSPKEVKDVFSILKDCAVEANENTSVELQIAYGVLFSLVVTFVSDVLSTSGEKASLSSDSSFRHDFHDLVMRTGNNMTVEGFVGVVRLAWTVHLMLTQDRSSSRDMSDIWSCLEVICRQNAFEFLKERVLNTAAYQNDDEDVVYMYTGYTHKLLMCFLSHPTSRDKIKEMKENAMNALSPYGPPRDHREDPGSNGEQNGQPTNEPFVSLLELVRGIYQKEPELVDGNEELWTFVIYAGEDHTNTQTLVAFLGLLSTLASTEAGASKVYELLQGKVYRSVGWNTLFHCLSVYEEKFKKSIQSSASMLPDFPEGDAQALVAYLAVLRKVVENGNPTERKNWFPDIEPLFKLLYYENVPPYVKGALRNAVAAFIKVSPLLKDAIWSYLEQYDLPVGTPLGHHSATQELMPCTVEAFPCIYLGLPLSIRKLRKEDFLFLIDKIADYLPGWKAALIHPAGRVALVKSVLAAVPIHLLIAVDCPKWVIKAIEKIFRGFMWKGRKDAKGGHCLVSWSKVCRDPGLGGLGIKNMEVLGWALRMRWLWKLKTEPDRWAGMKIQVHANVRAMFVVSVKSVVGNGARTNFWCDKWLHGQSICDVAPALAALVPQRFVNRRSVRDALTDQQWISDIRGDFTDQAFMEFFLLWDLLEEFHLDPEVEDHHVWTPSANGSYSSKSAYDRFFLGSTRFEPADRIWKSWAPPRCKFFIWLASLNRCWTADRLARRGMEHPELCLLCDQEQETVQHILCSCVFAREVWFRALSLCGLQRLSPTPSDSVFQEWWRRSLELTPKELRKALNSLIILVAWWLWKHRNRCVFEQASPNVQLIMRDIVDEVELWKRAGASQLCKLLPQ